MFQRLREMLVPPAPQPVFVDPTLGTLTWDPQREGWSAELGPSSARYRFEFQREKPSPVPPEPMLASAREMVGRLDFILRSTHSLLAAEADKSAPERAAEIRALTVRSFHLQMDRGNVHGDILLDGAGPNRGWHVILHNGMPMWLEIASS